MSEKERKHKRRSVKYDWTDNQIRALRLHLQQTQREMADELQVRQQTVSEWETGLHQPHRSMQKLLTMIAEQAKFQYQVDPSSNQEPPPPQETT